MRALAARAWPVTRVGAGYERFVQMFSNLAGKAAELAPLDAMATRVLLIHEYRRVVLRDPCLPTALLPPDWPGAAALGLCAGLYARLAPASERWLDTKPNGSGPLPQGPDPAGRFTSART